MYIHREGESMYSFYLPVWKGVNPETGLGEFLIDPEDPSKGVTNWYSEAASTIVGKAIFYYNQSHGIVDDTKEEPIKEQDGGKQGGRSMERFIDADSVPDWAKATVKKLTDKGLIKGNGESLDLSLDMLRVFVVNDRAGLY